MCRCRFRFLTLLLVASFSVLLTAGCDPAHLGADGDGGPPGGTCGDGRVGGDELCDDGNTVPGDGCDEECQPEIPPNCNDSILDDDEQCDDGNNDAGDGCGPGCWIEGCGNSHLDPGEVCEDGNDESGDGCSSDCKSDETCGNGIKDIDEVCDDGDGDDTDECPGNCELARCGDGFVRSGLETCDDGNDIPDDGCTNCILDSCGDGNPDPGEECDNGAANASPGSTCFINCISTTVNMGNEITHDLDVNDIFGLEPNAVETGDINGDGRLDLLITSQGNLDATAAYGFGDGRFWMPHYHTVGSSGFDIAIGDIDGNAFPDAVVASTNNTITVFLGTAIGFTRVGTASTSIDSGGSTPRAVVLADVTGDGELDAVTANESSDDVVILTGDGAGGFTATSRLSTLVGATGDGPFDVAVADITGNGNVDIITANSRSDDVAVFEGLGGGSYASPQIFTTRFGAGGDNPRALAIADVTNDAKLDVITANSTSDDVSVLANDADGGLNPPITFLTLSGAAGDAPQAVAVGDVTGDSIPDIVTANSTSGDVAILPGLGAGVAFGAAQHHSVADADGGGVNPDDVVIADLNGDGKPDIVTVNVSSDDASVLLGNGSGNFAEVVNFEVALGDGGLAPRGVVATDMNGDGNVDLAVAGGNRMMVIAGLGDGHLAPSQSVSISLNGHAVLGDMDDSGTLDIVAPRTTSITVAKQRLSGEFQQLGSNSGAINNICTAVGDFDSDGFNDAAAIDSSNSRVGIYINDDTGFMGSPTGVSVSTAQHLVAADVTGDNVLDIVVASGSSDAVSIATGSGTGTFGSFQQLTTAVSTSGQTPRFVQVVDLNGDNKADIVTANRDSNDVTVILGEGSGSFGDAAIVPAVFGADPARPAAVRAGDFNGDGILDLAVANELRDTVSILMGFGDGGFAAPQTFDVGQSPLGLAVGDFDGDGLADIASADLADSTITVRLGQGHP